MNWWTTRILAFPNVKTVLFFKIKVKMCLSFLFYAFCVRTLLSLVRFDSPHFEQPTITNTQFYSECTGKTIAKVVQCPYCHYCLCYFYQLIANTVADCVLVSGCIVYFQAEWSFSLNLHTLSIYSCLDFSLFVKNVCTGFSYCAICYTMSSLQYKCSDLSWFFFVFQCFRFRLSYHSKTFNVYA